MVKRGEEIPRPNPWTVKAADLRAGKGWDQLKSQFPEATDAAWVAMISDPRRTNDRQHQLKGELAEVSIAGVKHDQWQFEITSGGRIWYAVNDEERILWVTEATTGHPKKTDSQRRRNRG